MEDFEDKGFRMHSLESYLLVHLWACKFLLEFWLCLTFGLHAVLLGLLAALGSAWNDAFTCSKTTAAASTQAISMSTLISFAERPFEFLQFLSFLHFYCSQLQIWLLPVLKWLAYCNAYSFHMKYLLSDTYFKRTNAIRRHFFFKSHYIRVFTRGELTFEKQFKQNTVLKARIWYILVDNSLI